MSKMSKTTKKKTSSSPATPSNVEFKRIKEYDITVSTPLNGSDEITRVHTSNGWLLIGFATGLVQLYKYNSSSITFFTSIQPPVIKSSASNSVNFVSVDKLKKWIFVNYVESGLYIYELPGSSDSSENYQVQLLDKNVLSTNQYHAIALDELYKNERLAVVTSQSINVYQYFKLEKGKRGHWATKTRGIHMSLSHMSEISMRNTYLKFVGNSIIVANPISAQQYSLVILDHVSKAVATQSLGAESLEIKDMRKDAEQEVISLESTKKAKAKKPVTRDEMVPTRWKQFGTVDVNDNGDVVQFPEVFRVAGKTLLLRAGKNRFLPGSVDGLLLTRNDFEKNAEIDAEKKDKIFNKYLQDDLTGANNRYILDEIIFEHAAPHDVAFSFPFLASMVLADSNKETIFEFKSVVEPVSSQEEEQPQPNEVRVMLPIAGKYITNASNKSDFIVITADNNAVLLTPKYE